MRIYRIEMYEGELHDIEINELGVKRIFDAEAPKSWAKTLRTLKQQGYDEKIFDPLRR